MAIKIYIMDEIEGDSKILYSFAEGCITVHKNFTNEEFNQFLPVLKSVTDDITDFGENYLKI